MGGFLSLAGECRTEKVIEKSRFITTSAHVVEGEAAEFVARIRSEFKDATHNCYAYIADEKGNLLRFSDDGEPQGTAGMPMLEVLKNSSLKQVAAVVTRYFGGIKLGAGGLLRAYSGCVKENLSAAKIVEYLPCTIIELTVDYPLADTALRFLNARECTQLNVSYADKVIFSVAVKLEGEAEFVASLKNALCGRLNIARTGEYLRPFPIK